MSKIAILRQKAHGLPVESYADAVRERLPEATVTVARTPEQERAAVETATVISAGPFDDELLGHANEIQLFASIYAGYDHLPLDEFAEREIALTTASGVHGPNIAEHVIGAFLAFTRRFFEARRRQRERQWRALRSSELAGSTVAVVGLGAIGQAIVDRLAGFDVDTVGVRYSPEKGGPTDEVYGFDEIHEAVTDAEYVAVACPLTDATEELFDEQLFRTMHPEAIFVNVARGGVVDTDALTSAIQSNYIGAAQLDVTDPEPLPEDHPLWGFDNVFVTPHASGHTPAYYERTADILAENVRRAEETGEWDGLVNQVNLG
ncbi:MULTISPECIES: D-2-hydroxyacid dehydrogenase [Halomicrobium]|uniref:D-isomer specific 2-hydroxyacid dehydrogenase NAD-binding n=2 Tax=Halomicrobium mukohataei TaxID=57705 RepID=C7NYX7_HALMD|nr:MULTISPECIES: D-2-hydroxyacid dehydrogenase [Halomicrobium]ACV48666.1 D-isomer specific 2-hydroxyacid dehydrogenase NAD-binding [Halomicrobium mukohataei DSM 12286]QCD64097.1 D-2-hydroxyacid dehydrogenase [Halomicrobium mukohataei]QFR18903.1 D-2-hydroxyacid dehydrogenase [Halomicrobium sp. ZPS1]